MARQLHEAAPADHKDLVIVEDGTHNGLHERDTVQAAYERLLHRALRDAGTDE
jgi:hypothetical protein